jgi:hypothetical protein
MCIDGRLEENTNNEHATVITSSQPSKLGISRVLIAIFSRDKEKINLAESTVPAGYQASFWKSSRRFQLSLRLTLFSALKRPPK